MRYRLYRWWQEFTHRHGWHHTRTIYPAGPYGVERRDICDWCGISGEVMTEAQTRRIAAEMNEAARSL